MTQPVDISNSHALSLERDFHKATSEKIPPYFIRDSMLLISDVFDCTTNHKFSAQ